MSDSTLSASAVVGLDVGDRITHLCALDSDRNVIFRTRFATTRKGLLHIFGAHDSLRVVLEAGSQSPWLFAELRELGHRVHVVDPRRIALISKSHRKTDRRDAETLARMELGMPELLGDVHHRPLEDQARLAIVRARDLCVGMRTQSIQHVRGTLKAFGIPAGKCSTSCFHRKVRSVIPPMLEEAFEGVLATLDTLEKQINDYDRRLRKLTSEELPDAARLQQVNGVGPVLTSTYMLTVSDPTLFSTSREVGSWVGLAPRVQSSGDRDPQLPISKTGDKYLRHILIQSAQYILGPFGQDCDLRRFGKRLEARGGKGAKNRAVVAVARKLAVLLHRLWVSGEPYDPWRQERKKGRARAAS